MRLGRGLYRVRSRSAQHRTQPEQARRQVAALRQRHDAVLVATGVYQARDLEVPGVGSAGVVPALDYLIASNRLGLGDERSATGDRL